MQLVFGPPVLMMTEGQATPGVVMIGLDQEWSTDITVTVTSSNPNVATVLQESVTFPAMTMTAKPIQVLAPVDDDTINGTTTIVANAVETGAAIVTVNVDDPDVQSLLPLPTKVSMTEGRTETLSLRLAKKPAGTVVVTLASSNSAKLTLDMPMLTFNAANYSIPQAVTLTGVKDDDAMSEHVSVSLTATGNIESLSVPVDITDIDAVNLDVTPSSLKLEERAAMPGTIMVALTKAPPNDMNVQVASSDATKVTVTPALLAFTAANFATPQAVTVAAVPDNDAHDESEKITFTATGITPAPEPRDVAVTVHDSDSQSIMATPAMVNLVEGGSGSFTVQLALQPDGDTTVNVYSQNPDELQLVPPVLHFNATNYNVPQTITVMAQQDDDLADDNVNVTLIGSAASSVTVSAHIADDDHQSIQLVPAGGGSSLVMQEGAASALGVRLAFRPPNGATVTFTASTKTGPDKLSVTPSQVVFSGADYSVPKFVTLSALHLPDMVDIQAAITASQGDSTDVTLPVTILDIDTQNLLVDTDAINVTEGGGVAGAASAFNLKLALQPPAAITPTFTLSPSLTGKVAIDSTACASLSGVTAMMTGCAVTVTPIADNDIRKESGTITVTAPGLTPRTISVTVTDTDTQGLVMVPTSIPAIMEGLTGTFMVGLKANPVDPVTVSVLSGDPTHFTVSPATLAFTSDNFAAGLKVTVTALDDNDMASYASSISVQGAGAGATAPATASVNVAETNTDAQAIVISPGPSLTMLEGSMAQLGVRLAYRPVAGEVVTLTSTNPSLLQFGGVASTTVMFDNTSSYSTNQFVTLTSIKDSNMIDDTVSVTATSSVAGTLTPAAEMVVITDLDMLNFTVSPSTAPVVIPEAANSTDSTNDVLYTVGLTVTPAARVSVSVSSTIPSSSLSATFDGGPCTLDSITSTCQLRIRAVKDINAVNESGTITISGGSAIASSPTIPVSTRDNDTQALVLSPPASPNIHERGASATTTFNVSLLWQPVGDVTVTVSAVPDQIDGILVYPTAQAGNTACTTPGTRPSACTTLTFNATNYLTTQSVTVAGISDSDLRSDPFSIRVSASGLGISDAFVNVTEIDDDTQKIIISNPPCSTTGADLNNGGEAMLSSVVEGDSSSLAQFCVSLKYQPLTTNFVDVAPSPTLVLSYPRTVTPPAIPLAFTTSNYNVPQLLSYFVPSDLDATDTIASVNLSSSGFLATRKVSFTATDLVDRAAQVFHFVGLDGAGSISIPKGTSSTSVSVWIPFDPITSPTVATCSSASSLVTVSSATFTGGAGGTWGAASTARTLTINVGTDTNPSAEPVVITCTAPTATPPIPAATFTVNAQ